MSRLVAVLVLVIGLALPSLASADGGASSKVPPFDPDASPAVAVGLDETQPPDAGLPAERISPELAEKTNKRLIAEQETAIFTNEHRISVFNQQYWTSWIIFIVVHLLVGLGVYFSWMQLQPHLLRRRTAARDPKREGASDVAADDPQPLANSSIRVGTSGIEVSSPIVGVIILGLSFAFFYAYLQFVYPISYADPTTPKATAAEPSQK